MTPWDFWSRSVSTGLASAQTGLRFAELMRASQEVVASRCDTIAHAARDPLNGNYRELARMVPEKVDAFGSAASSTAADLHAINVDAAANWQQLTAMAMGFRLPTLAEIDAISTRTMRMTERALGAGGKAMRPLHTAATGNAKRLKNARA